MIYIHNGEKGLKGGKMKLKIEGGEVIELHNIYYIPNRYCLLYWCHISLLFEILIVFIVAYPLLKLGKQTYIEVKFLYQC